MKERSILFINSSRIYGGTEKWTMIAAKELQNRGYPVSIIHRYPIIGEMASQFSLPAIQLPLRNDGDLLSLLSLKKIIKKNNIELVISTKPREYWLGTLAARLVGAKSLLRLGIVREIQNKWKNRKIWRDWSSGIIVNSHAILNALVKIGFIPAEKIYLVYNGVEVLKELPPFEEHPNIFRFIYVGQLQPRKRVEFLIKGYQRLCEMYPGVNSQLWIVGDGPEKAKLEDKARETGFAEKIIFCGFRRDVPQLLIKTHGMLFPSTSEGIPNALLESLAVGVPVIAHPFPGLEEVITHGETGLITNFEDIGGTAQQLYSFIQNSSLRRRLRQKGYEMVKRKFSLDQMGNQLEAILQDLTNAR